MTSSSKLFHSRRISFGTDDSSPPDGGRTDRRHHHHRRHDLGGCNTNTRRLHRHHLPEPEVAQVEQGVVSQPSSGSIINSEDFRSIRRWGATGNDRLPGVVLLARERLLERLRGVHVLENRQSSSSASSIHPDDLSYSSFIESNNNMLEESVSESWQSVMPMSSMTKMLPPGLSQHALNHLSVMVFNNVEDDESSSASRECSICLEGFENGDELINLPCVHRFHSCCLLPWVEVCGACPNCRKDIVVTSN
ncbi:Zinc finger, RING/FYVE/PHD-type [Artemisia annua]|uniref:Zinc finger, RING/FYVE/PHD-type n=1 Tax=Artemisia annua TaxID=35608 RepID=A0A2U1MLM7_ARTAN|nr:Zinc finger, RING/FYVE/PHD-type [Artemisia annua]